MHGRRETENRYDVAFVGNVFPGVRQDFLERIQQRFPRSFIGQMGYQQMASVYSAAKIVFNCSLRDDINMRVFEGLCSGSLLITNDLASNGQNDFITPDQHLVTYQSWNELAEKIEYYLIHDTEREQIAAAGRELAVSQHTYRHRMEVVLERLGNRGEKREERGQRRILSPVPSSLSPSPYPLLPFLFPLLPLPSKAATTTNLTGPTCWNWCRPPPRGCWISAAAGGSWGPRSSTGSRRMSPGSS